MLAFAMSFLYGAKDKIDSSIKLRLFCTIMIGLFTHYRKSHFKKFLVTLRRVVFLLSVIFALVVFHVVFWLKLVMQL